MEGVMSAYANVTLPSSVSAVAGAPSITFRASSSHAISRRCCLAGIVCSSSSTRSNGKYYAPLSRIPVLVSLASAGLLNVAAASAADADADATIRLVEGLLSQEPANALSLPTWTIHVASVVEWIVAMGLVWRFGDNPKNSAWKGLTWGMVPLLGGAMCACTWHFFYNAESLEILVVLQAALTMLGNFTMWLAAYRIYRASSKSF